MSELFVNSINIEIIHKFIRSDFFAFVCLNYFYFFLDFSLNKFLKNLEFQKSFQFYLHKINLALVEIINFLDYKISKSIP